MPTTIINSRVLRKFPSEARRAARNGPVIITHRGHPTHVLLSIDEYRRLTISTTSITELLAMPACDVADLEIERLPDVAQGVDLE